MKNFQEFLVEKKLRTVLVNHYQRSGDEYDTYSWHYELFESDIDSNELPQNSRIASPTKEELALGIEELLMYGKTFEIYNTSIDETYRLYKNKPW
jgi:hypothetical protein